MNWEQDNIYLPDRVEFNWSEEDWEKFFQGQDRRAEQYQKKFEEVYYQYKEKYDDDTQPNKIIQSELNVKNPVVYSNWLEFSLNNNNSMNTDEVLLWDNRDSIELRLEIQQAELDYMPVYQNSLKFGIESPKLFKPFYEKNIDTPEVHQFHLHCYQIAAHIISGHSFGYEKDGLTGNIAKLNRSLKSAQNCLESLLAIERKKLDCDQIRLKNIIRDNIQIRDLLIYRIAELRKQVWW